LPNHTRAQPASEAARCAGAQGKFGEDHDRIFANQRQLEDANLKTYAEELELDMAAFNTCLETGQFKAQIVADYQGGSRLGVTGTPAFFVNGRFLNGAQPFEAFKEIIDDELTR
jgi:protein-disulfide isomerase